MNTIVLGNICNDILENCVLLFLCSLFRATSKFLFDDVNFLLSLIIRNAQNILEVREILDSEKLEDTKWTSRPK